MAPKYKLSYFDGRGLAEAIRWLLCYMEEEFEDVRLDQQGEEWKKIKPTTPFGRVPVLEENGKALCQSVAIIRYLGKEAGLGGDNNWENVQIDIIADTLTDIHMPIGTFMFETDKDIKKAKQEAYINETLTYNFKKLEEIVKANEGYVANKKLSWGDFMFTTVSELISATLDVDDITADYPNLHALREKIFNLPQVKKWVEKRPPNAW